MVGDFQVMKGEKRELTNFDDLDFVEPFLPSLERTLSSLLVIPVCRLVIASTLAMERS